MDPRAQQIAIAEACGWAYCPATGFTRSPDGRAQPDHSIPDYLHDLNAMHEAERGLDPDDYAQYEQNIRKTYPVFMGGGFHLLHATAAQRAEAFLCTIGKWTS